MRTMQVGDDTDNIGLRDRQWASERDDRTMYTIGKQRVNSKSAILFLA